MNTQKLPVKGWQRALLEDSSERRDLLSTLDGDDPGEALFLDPALAVRATPSHATADSEVADVKRAVLQAKRLRMMEQSDRKVTSTHASSLAVAMALFLLFLVPASLKRAGDPVQFDAREALPLTHSSVEAIDRPGARVYELANEDFSLVLVVDETFEL